MNLWFLTSKASFSQSWLSSRSRWVRVRVSWCDLGAHRVHSSLEKGL